MNFYSKPLYIVFKYDEAGCAEKKLIIAGGSLHNFGGRFVDTLRQIASKIITGAYPLFVG